MKARLSVFAHGVLCGLVIAAPFLLSAFGLVRG
jgi:hypothetical protein